MYPTCVSSMLCKFIHSLFCYNSSTIASTSVYCIQLDIDFSLNYLQALVVYKQIVDNEVFIVKSRQLPVRVLWKPPPSRRMMSPKSRKLSTTQSSSSSSLFSPSSLESPSSSSLESPLLNKFNENQTVIGIILAPSPGLLL